ncbi:SDR family NAD(P)-dependent oxidoreductase [Thalassotalea psychrophila]|uniref:SDR family NAD(P)-dependent oxidoreductase n=1 Tax=Thalassotalea psychrophila TaxID=3065647 RepID=A0ABY9TXH3_9GAMM|nr:SDR family NAD(P)-dependent oxidoreductase [Colwelliaceae bacterium SQ149]
MKKNIVVIGASSGMGKDLVKALVVKGHNVYCAARRIEKLEELKQLGAQIFKMDITNEVQVNDVIAQIIADAGYIDVVYSNAGYAIAGPVEETPIAKVHEQFQTNVYGAAIVTRAVLPHMRERNEGRIIFTTSIAGRVSTGMNSWYSASKHALNGMVKGLAQELNTFNIKVVTIEPGCVLTEFDGLQLADMKSTNKLDAYSDATQQSHDFLYDAYRKGSDTRSTVKTMLRAGFSKNPKLSYRSTLDAKILNALQAIVGEKLLGKIFNRLVSRF